MQPFTDVGELHRLFLQTTGISTDTRSIGRDCLFVALKGANFNGNAFAAEALAKGAKYALIDQADYQIEGKTILCEDSLQMLQKLANFHRQSLSIPFIGITGSNGKTTSKELLKAVLSTRYRTHATQGNLNNHIGVPLTLLAIDTAQEIAVIEMGANRMGDIDELCAIAQPNYGLITNIGQAHLEGFGGTEGVIKAKSELYKHLAATQGTVFVNVADALLRQIAQGLPPSVRQLSYGTEDSFLPIRLIEAAPYVVYEVGTERVQTRLLGAYNLANIAAALCIGKYFGVDMQAAHQAIAQYEPTNNRSQVIRQSTNTIILDAYNANPSSMRAAIENFAHLPTESPKVLIAGDMFELGDYSAALHQEIIDLAAAQPFESCIFCGKEFGKLAYSDSRLHFFEHTDSLIQYLRSNYFSNTYILIKGSRGMGLERVVPHLPTA